MAAIPATTNRTATPVIAVIAAAIVLSGLLGGCGSEDTPAPDTGATTVEIIATEYRFEGDPATTIAVGDTVRFVVRNEGGLDHEMQVLDTDARLIDRTARLGPGDVGEVTVTFDQPGVYQVICDIDDHLSRGQRASFTIG